MPRGKDAPTRVGGQIDPYVQRSLQQGKQQAESRLVAAMQEAGATGRTAMQETGATERAGIQAATQRAGMASRAESEDKRAAENEMARRDDQEFSKTMAQVTHEMQAKEAILDRDMQKAMFNRNLEAKEEVAARQRSLDKLRMLLGEKAQERDTNLIASMAKGMRKSMAAEEKVNTTMLEQADQFDNDKGKYEAAKESHFKAIENDKRMDLSARKPRPAFRGAGAGMTWAMPEESLENLADPIGVLQDLIIKREGKISVEDLSSANIHKVEEQMVKDKIQTEDINETFGAIDAMLESVDEKRKAVDKKSDEFDFWNDKHIEISQFKRNLVKLEDSDKKIEGVEIETVGKRMIYALRTIRKGSLGNRASRFREARGDGSVDGFYDEITKPLEPYELLEITPDMDKYDVENWTDFNNMIMPLYMKSQQQSGIGGLEQ